MDQALNLRVQLWGSTTELTETLQAQASILKKALNELGLHVESLVVIEGKLTTRTEKPMWQQPLIDCHG